MVVACLPLGGSGVRPRSASMAALASDAGNVHVTTGPDSGGGERIALVFLR